MIYEQHYHNQEYNTVMHIKENITRNKRNEIKQNRNNQIKDMKIRKKSRRGIWFAKEVYRNKKT